MLSPPYSPHADLLDEFAIERENAVKTPNYAKPPSQSLHCTQSNTCSGDELTDNDDFEDDESSGSVPPQDCSRFRMKRSASDAFAVPDEDLFHSSAKSRSVSPSSTTDSRGSSPASSISSGSGHERRMTTCWDALKTDPAKYLRQERSLLEMYPLRRHSWAGPAPAAFGSDDSDLTMMSGHAAAAAAAAVAAVSSSRSTGRGRGRRAYRSPSQANGANSNAALRGRRRNASDPPHSPSATTSTSTEMLESGESALTADESSVSGALRQGSPGASGVRVHDLSLHQIKDYSPSLKTLPPGKSLRAEWKGAPMDLSNDPDLKSLHPAEVHLASVLRLPCEVYLDSKRRLFAEKVHRLRQGLPFRRTDSQKACRIDVNKASRLFGAFEKIGWLEDELFLQYLN